MKNLGKDELLKIFNKTWSVASKNIPITIHSTSDSFKMGQAANEIREIISQSFTPDDVEGLVEKIFKAVWDYYTFYEIGDGSATKGKERRAKAEILTLLHSTQPKTVITREEIDELIDDLEYAQLMELNYYKVIKKWFKSKGIEVSDK